MDTDTTRLSSHGKYDTVYHVSWATKYRRPTLTYDVQEYLSDLFPQILEGRLGCEILAFKAPSDHVHLVMIIPPKYAVKDVIGRLKGSSSSRLLEKFYWAQDSVWSTGYFVRTVGAGEDKAKVISYVLNNKPDSAKPTYP